MKKQISPFLLILMILAITLACSLPGLTPPTPTDEPQLTQEILEAEITATEDAPPTSEPTATAEVIPTPEPTATETAPTAEPTTPPVVEAGQIAYIYNGNVYRYLIDSDQTVQVTTDGIPGDHMNSYGNPGISPDGRYLAFNKGTSSWIKDLVNDTLTDISTYGQFFTWTGEETDFFGVQGDFACPDIDNLDDQVLINFDILRFDLNDLANPTHLANIGGGLKFLQAISNDGEWASVVSCGCYSECGYSGLWNVPTMIPLSPPPNLQPGDMDFSPDSSKLTVSHYQMHGYVHSPLYVASSNYGGMVEIFSHPNVAPINAKWSPDGEWIAFTGVIFTDDGFDETDRCVRLIKPDGSKEYVAECLSADFVTWSPDGDQLLYSQMLGTQKAIFIYDLATSARTKLPIQVDPYLIPRSIDWGRLQ